MIKTYLAHHGVKKQKWYVRRYQNPDGSLTPYGKKRRYRERYKRLITGDLSSDTAAKKNELEWIATKAKYKHLRESTKDPQLLEQYERELDKERLLYTRRVMTIERRHERQESNILSKIVNDEEYKNKMTEIHNINEQINSLSDSDSLLAKRKLKQLNKQHYELSSDIGKRITDGYSEVKISYIDDYAWNEAMRRVNECLKKY